MWCLVARGRKRLIFPFNAGVQITSCHHDFLAAHHAMPLVSAAAICPRLGFRTFVAKKQDKKDCAGMWEWERGTGEPVSCPKPACKPL